MNKAHWCWLIPLVLVLLFCGGSAVIMNIDSAYENHRVFYHREVMRDFVKSEVERAGYGEKLDDDAMERIRAKYGGFAEWLPSRLQIEHHLWGFWRPILYKSRLHEFCFYLKYRLRQ